MRDAIQLENQILTDGRADFKIIGFFLTETGSTYVKVHNQSTKCYINHQYTDFKNFLEKNSLQLKPKSELAV